METTITFNYPLINVLAFLAAFILTAIALPIVIRSAVRYHKVDNPGIRKIHTSPVPRLGGIAFIPIALLTTTLIIGTAFRFGSVTGWNALSHYVGPILLAGTALAFIYGVGVVDDLVGVRYRVKFGVQLLASLLVILSGTSLDNLGGFLGIEQLPQWISWVLTIIFFIGLTNSMNLIDGIDGLCASLSFLAFLCFGFISQAGGKISLGLLSFTCAGAICAFSIYNIWGKAERNHKIFMGDTGSMSLGLLLGYAALQIPELVKVSEIPTTGQSLVYAFTPLMLPVMDAIRVFLLRIRQGRNPFLADNNHIHHKLLALGLSQKKTLCWIIFFDIMLITFNYLTAPCLNINLIVAIDVVWWVAINYALSGLISRQKNKIS